MYQASSEDRLFSLSILGVLDAHIARLSASLLDKKCPSYESYLTQFASLSLANTIRDDVEAAIFKHNEHNED